MGRYISLPPGWNNNNLEAQFNNFKRQKLYFRSVRLKRYICYYLPEFAYG